VSSSEPRRLSPKEMRQSRWDLEKCTRNSRSRALIPILSKISREDLDGEYYDRVFGDEGSNSDMDMSDDDK